MAFCEFSEFSFGYALTDSLVNAFRDRLGVAPVFANQVTEGKPGGGYDMKLPLNPVPIFFQFKIPSVMTRVSKHMPSGYWTPYYRMFLRTRKPNQYQLLLDLQKTQPLVYYVAPVFDRIADLNRGFITKSIQTQCLFIKPSGIGPLDGTPHHVSYKKGANSWIHSDPKEIGSGHDFDAFLEDVRVEAAKARGADTGLVEEGRGDVPWTGRNRAVLGAISRWLLENHSRDDYFIYLRQPQQLEEEIDSPSGVARVLGYVAQIRYGLALAFVDANIKEH